MSLRLRPRSLASLLVLSAAFGLLAGARSASGQEAAWTTNGPLGGSVYCLVPDPSHPSTLYAGTAMGVFKSDDGGASWRSASSGLPSFRVQTIAIDPTTPSTLYAGTLTPDGVDSVGIFKSTDGAASWTAINEGLIDPLTGISPLDVWSLAIDPKNPGTILAGSRFSEIFKSVDGGLTWQPKTFGGFQYLLETSAIRFDPTNSSRILAASNPLGLLVSTDGGEDWSTFGNASDTFFTIVADPTTPATLYAGNTSGSGIFKSTDSGAHWSTINKGLPGGSGALPLVRGFAVDPSHPANLYAGTYGNGLFRSTDGGLNWSSANGAMRSNYVAAIAVGQSSTLLAGTLFSGVYRSADNAATWTSSEAGIDIAQVTALLADPASPGTVYAATFDGVSKSVDGGGTWLGVNNGLPIAPVSALASRSGSPRTLLAATLGSGVWKSTDGGATWTSSAQGLTDTFIGSLVVDPSNSSTVYAGTDHSGTSSQRVFKSTDGGATWTQTSLDAGQSPNIVQAWGGCGPGMHPVPGHWSRLLPESRRGKDLVDHHDERELRRSQHDLLRLKRDPLGRGHRGSVPLERRRKDMDPDPGRIPVLDRDVPDRPVELLDPLRGRLARRSRRHRRRLPQHRRRTDLGGARRRPFRRVRGRAGDRARAGSPPRRDQRRRCRRARFPAGPLPRNGTPAPRPGNPADPSSVI